MRFVIEQTVFADLLNTVSKAVATRPTHPILANIKLEATKANSSVTATGYDLSIGLIQNGIAAIVEDGSITVPSKIFCNIINQLPDEDLTISLEKNNIINIKASCGEYKVNGLPADEFPELPVIVGDDAVTISCDVLAKGLSAVAHSMSQEETKRILCTTFINKNEFVSTDGHRLSVYGVEDLGLTALIPFKACRELAKLCKTPVETIKLRQTDSDMVFTIGSTTLISRKIDGTFPRYEVLIPTDFASKIIIERKLMLSSVERLMALAAPDKGNILTMDIGREGMVIRNGIQDVVDGCEQLPFTSDEPIVIAFNGKYLLSTLQNIDAREIVLKLNTPTSPAVFEAIGENKWVNLLMPVQIRS